MRNAIKLAAAAACALGVSQAGAATILDSGTTTYYGADNKGAADVIGGSTYDISQATIARAGNVLTITITTSAATDDQARELLRAFGMPFAQSNSEVRG